jgi:perosamine synthetase
MTDEPIRLAYPTAPADALEQIRAVLDSGRWTQGEAVARFGDALALHFHAEHAVLLNSGTSALIAMLKYAGIGPGDHVAVPDYSFVATANAVALIGAIPVFVDVNEADFGMDVAALESLSPSPDAVLLVHQFGLPANLERIKSWAEQNGVHLFEDSACALGTTVDGEPLGFSSEASAFSFHPRKIVSTGEGGAILTNDSNIANHAAAFANHGFDDRGVMTAPGMNLRMPELSAALGLSMLHELPNIVEARNRVFSWYRERLAGLSLPNLGPNVSWNVQTLVVVLEERIDRDALVAGMALESIETNVPARSISQQPYFRDRHASARGEFPVSRRLHRQAIGLPCHEHLTEPQVDRVCATLIQLIEGR